MTLNAQLSGGSPYSSFGIGTMDQLDYGINRAFAGGGIGLQSSQHYNGSNPAGIAQMAGPANVLFSTGLSFDVNQLNTNSESIWQRDGGLTHLMAWIKPTAMYAFTLGIEPYSSVKYNIISNNSREVFGERYTALNSGSGGLSRFFFGHGFNLPGNLDFGAELGVIFGSINKDELLIPAGIGSRIQIGTVNYLNSVDARFGLQWKQQIGNGQLNLGATYRPGINFNSTVDFNVTAQSDTILLAGIDQEETFEAPENIGIGISYQFGRWLFGADASFTSWSQAQNDENINYQDSWAYTLYGQVALGDQAPVMAPRSVVLRAGVRYQTSNLEIDNTTADEVILSTGLSIPYRYGRNHIDLSYSLHLRGTQSSGLIQENRHSLGISIALRDLWFQQRKFN